MKYALITYRIDRGLERDAAITEALRARKAGYGANVLTEDEANEFAVNGGQDLTEMFPDYDFRSIR